MLGIGIDIGSTAMKIHAQAHSRPALARGDHLRRYSPGPEATSPIFSRLSTKSAISAAD